MTKFWQITFCAVALLGLPSDARCASAAQPAGLPQDLLKNIAASDPNDPSNAQIIQGTGAFTTPHRSQKAAIAVGGQGDITLNFVNTDVRDIAKAVLGDYLKLNYEIAAGVQGSITLQTSQPLSRAQVLPALEEALRLNGMGLVHSASIYKVVPLAEARRSSGVIGSAPSRSRDALGYGSDVAPIRYTSAAEMAKLLEPLVPAQGIIHVDAARNLLIVEGTAEERRTMLDDIALFDSDWLSGMSFALFTPSHTDAEELTAEINEVMGGVNSPVAGVVRLVPIDRLNMILAISPQARYLQQLRAWITRLDRPGQGTDKRIFVYHVQNGRASDLAATLAKALFGGQNAGSSQTQHAPPQQMANGATSDSLGQASAPAPAANVPAEAMQISGSMAGMGTGHSIGPVNITSDETNNALVIVASPQEYATIESALHQLDTAPVQVFLEAAIAEVTLTNDLHYGVQYFYKPNAQNQFVLSSSGTANITPSFPGFSYMFLNGTNIQVILDALSAVTHVEVISSPELMVLNNQSAMLQVGDKVPIATQQAVSTIDSNAPIVNSIEYEDTGVILKVTPRVNRGGVVMMDISQEVSEVSSTTSSALNSPTIQERKITSSVAIQDGQTVALGGLIMNNESITKGGIPFLKDVPLLGNLFADTQNDKTRTELMVLITPHVVDDSAKAQAITNELRHKLPTVEALFEAEH